MDNKIHPAEYNGKIATSKDNKVVKNNAANNNTKNNSMSHRDHKSGATDSNELVVESNLHNNQDGYHVDIKLKQTDDVIDSKQNHHHISQGHYQYEQERKTKCGYLCWKPTCLQKIRSPKIILLIFATAFVLQVIK